VTDTDDWLTRFEQNHKDLRNPFVYWVSILMLVVGLTGLLWGLPIPAEFLEISPLLNWGSAFLMVTAIYYFIISLSLAIGLLPFLLGLASIQMWLINSGYPASAIAAGLLITGVVGLILDRGGSARSVAEDLQLMMIGPAWLLSLVYRRFRMPI